MFSCQWTWFRPTVRSFLMILSQSSLSVFGEGRRWGGVGGCTGRKRSSWETSSRLLGEQETPQSGSGRRCQVISGSQPPHVFGWTGANTSRGTLWFWRRTSPLKQEEMKHRERGGFSLWADLFPQEMRNDFFLSEMSKRLIKAEQPVSVCYNQPHMSFCNNNTAKCLFV